MDLNLLTALEALLAEGSVTGAADRLRTSVPGMSRTLARLRRATGDELLVRAGRGMVLTPRAEGMRPEVAELLQHARGHLSPVAALDPAELERAFTLRWHDAVITAHAAALTARVRAQAPAVRLRFLAEPAGELDDVRHGSIDLHAGGAVPDLPDVVGGPLGTDELVVALRHEHPLTRGRLTLAGYAAAEHVAVSRRGRLQEPVDGVLAFTGAAGRRVVVAVPTTTAALHLVAGSDLLAVVPQRTTAELVRTLGLVIVEPPVRLPPVALHQFWHRRHDGDHAHRWLRAVVREVVAAPTAGAGGPGRR